MKTKCSITYTDIVSLENLFCAWEEFVKGRRRKSDVQEFQLHLADNILSLHQDLMNKTYRHGPYEHFTVTDPKRRDIHKASVRDRLLHHALHQKLYPYFDRLFISDVYSSRKGKGTHRAMKQFRRYGYTVSKNNTRTCYVLKCDIKKFFASIDHSTLMTILGKHIAHSDTLWLLKNVITSFEIASGTGLPLGNLTSQLLVNVYMNEFDQFVKHMLKAKHYIRYADDFVLLHHDREWLEDKVLEIEHFLWDTLKLTMHPDKVYIKTLARGVDFLGWVHFPNHRALRTATKRRMFKKLENNVCEKTLQSYIGMLQHGNTHRLRQKLIQYRYGPR